MPKNIIIFSDGTGQGSGLTLDELRSNVYKLYRATRSAPDTCISPDRQIAFYDPGLGSSLDSEHIRSDIWRKAYNILAQAMGLGLTRNIVDCYAFLLRHWEEGDRVYLYGFSRGAYTVRCLGGVMAYCGIPVTEGGKPVFRDPETAERIAREAVIGVYQHGLGRKSERFKTQRHELALRFREKYGSNVRPEWADTGWSNAVPYFIGVWDTVAAVGASAPRKLAMGAVILAVTWGLVSLVYWGLTLFFQPSWLTYQAWICAGVALAFIGAVLVYLRTHLAWSSETSYPLLQTLHFRAWKMAFYDKYLNPRVEYAKHALSIDENRKDFRRVEWTYESSQGEGKSDDWFEQVWFAGVHSDVGGSYPETESRLSDIALGWMVERSLAAKDPILIDEAYLRIYPDPSGIQHDEIKSGRMKWPRELRSVPEDAPLHPSVIERLKLDSVVHYDAPGKYRPSGLSRHREAKSYFEEQLDDAVEEAASPRGLLVLLVAAAVLAGLFLMF
ncbi:DUF2235 domain-containing protein [Pseudohoeflea suaedae]|uniref:DUF2235 domain-containing protein n=1 Tax=Pseudohoeflea suaedae TaxID=877384 RepID=A0A4R5PNF1_9HYPH|nr:DUF2235 domain-containing protein [Pseudohoeflea suaedae]TDH38131.1 DUF2235 domain-containing protein [Pseudohoeflea suaedae]